MASSPVADVSRGLPADGIPPAASPAFRPGLGVRAGVAQYSEATQHDIEARSFVGLFAHLAECETSRLECELAYHPSARDPSDNYYMTIDARYVRYLGTSQKSHVSAGLGGAWESWYGSRSAAPVAGASFGYWLPLGPRGIEVRATLQTPLAGEGGAPVIAVVSLGMDL
jgi:hypothetical protein